MTVKAGEWLTMVFRGTDVSQATFRILRTIYSKVAKGEYSKIQEVQESSMRWKCCLHVSQHGIHGEREEITVSRSLPRLDRNPSHRISTGVKVWSRICRGEFRFKLHTVRTILPAGCYGEAGTYTLVPTGKRVLTAGKSGEDEVGDTIRVELWFEEAIVSIVLCELNTKLVCCW